MNIPKPYTYLTCLVAFLAVALMVTAGIPTGKAQARGSLAPAPLTAPTTVNGERFATGRQDGSWNARHDLSTLHFSEGSPALLTAQRWGAPAQQYSLQPGVRGDIERASTYEGGTPGNQRLVGMNAAADTPHKVYLPIVSRPAVASRYFTTLPPGSALPSDAECAAMVKRRAENKGINRTYNATPGNQKLASDFFDPYSNDSRANSVIAARVTGNFTGTTDEILQWAACKWGVDEDMVRAQAAVESWWRQDTLGDWTSNSGECAPGHGLGADGRSGQCPGSWGILQNRYSIERSSWPGIQNSTAFNADTAYAIWRACFEGYEWWLNHVERGWDYGAGDAYGCMGRWYSGRWHTGDAEYYISKVKEYYNGRVWEQDYFQEP